MKRLCDHLELVLVNNVTDAIFPEHDRVIAMRFYDLPQDVHASETLGSRTLEPADAFCFATVVALRAATIETRRNRQVMREPSELLTDGFFVNSAGVGVLGDGVGNLEESPLSTPESMFRVEATKRKKLIDLTENSILTR